MSDPIDRRRFLIRVIAVIFSGIAAAIGAPAVAFMVGPSRKAANRHEVVSLGSVSRVELRAPTLVKAAVERKTGWVTTKETLGVYVKTDDGRNFVAMSNICTHLACLVRWVEDERKFYCPCHAGIYDENGNVLSGPPPRPLDRYDITVDDGTLLLHLTGTSEQSGSQTS